MKIGTVHKYSFHEYLSTTLFLQQEPPALRSRGVQSILEGIGKCQRTVVPRIGWFLRLPAPHGKSQRTWSWSSNRSDGFWATT